MFIENPNFIGGKDRNSFPKRFIKHRMKSLTRLCERIRKFPVQKLIGARLRDTNLLSTIDNWQKSTKGCNNHLVSEAILSIMSHSWSWGNQIAEKKSISSECNILFHMLSLLCLLYMLPFLCLLYYFLIVCFVFKDTLLNTDQCVLLILLYGKRAVIRSDVFHFHRCFEVDSNSANI